MEDSFRLRVEKIFGSLSTSSASSSSSSSSSSSAAAASAPSTGRPLWCLTDEEIEKKEWNRDKGSPETEADPTPASVDDFYADLRPPPQKSSRHFGEELQDDLDDLEDDEGDEYNDEEPSSRAQSRQREGTALDEDWEIRSSIGLDCTLDNEDEEDDYDKVAVGKENATDRLYMKDINDYGVGLNCYKVLPDSLGEAGRDPRANHSAAKNRLKEDVDAAKNFNSLQVSDTSFAPSDAQLNLKPILKRSLPQTSMRSEKRVRFDPGCIIDSEKEDVAKDDSDIEMGGGSVEVGAGPEEELEHCRSVPDYLVNPSRYTCYTLDDEMSEVDERSNRHAYMDFLNTLKKSKGAADPEPDETSSGLPKSITFTPKKKTGNTEIVKQVSRSREGHEQSEKDQMQRKQMPIIISAGDAQEGDGFMEEDGLENVADEGNRTRRPRRQYRRERYELDEPLA